MFAIPKTSALFSRHSSIIAGILLLIGIGACYANSFGIGFYFDDAYGIVNNPAIRSFRNIPRFFLDPFAVWTEATQVDMRPFLLISFALNYAISGLSPWSYHVLNLLLHFTAAFLVYFIVRDHLWWPASERGPQGEARFPAAAAALFFALAPLNSQPVNYIWARSALLCVTLYLGALLAFLRQRRWLGAVLYSLALFTKAIAVTLPAAILLHDFLYRDRRHRSLRRYLRDWPRLIRLIAIPALLAGGYVLYRHLVLPPWTAQARQSPGITPWVWFMSQWSAQLYYVRLFFWPVGLSADHDFPYTTSLLATRAWLPLLTILTWLAAAVRLAPRYPQVAFATFWFFITLSPESSFAPLAEVINDHRPYIATSLGLSLLLAWLLDRAAALAGPRHRAAFCAAVALVCLVAIPATRYRTWQWGDGLRIWEATVEASPNNGRAWMNAGLQYMSRGDFREARRHFERARELSPRYAYVYMNLSVLEAAEGNLDAALADAQQAVQLQPQLSLTHFYLGNALEKLGRTDDAVAAYQAAVDRNHNDTRAAQALSRLTGPVSPEESLMADGLYALRTLNDPAHAAESFRRVLELNPTHYGATFQLARALDASGRPGEARRYWEQAEVMAEKYADRATLEAARTRLAQQDAINDEGLMRMGLNALQQRNAGAAAEYFRQVLEHTPTHYGATYQLAAALDAAGKSNEALPVWRKVLHMAEGYGDTATASTARSRLSRQSQAH